jgi:hypothetical protein
MPKTEQDAETLSPEAIEAYERLERWANESETDFTNYYCHCGIAWTDQWSSTCNDRCDECGAEIEPYLSEDKDGRLILHVGPDFVPEGGWPEGCTQTSDLPGWPKA